MRLGKEFDILKGILTTEKTSRTVVDGKYYFVVDSNANKNDIKDSIEKIFGVNVESVNIINTEGKVKKFKGIKGKRNSVKKAVVTIKKGQDINLGKLE
ncbi:MAG TPA: 50S ribosomal protein L23 [Rickettsiales bacterium]|nr:50S ribosomal protein L23 [Rickettsiales bacterium]